jgi:hypothetical protein
VKRQAVARCEELNGSQALPQTGQNISSPDNLPQADSHHDPTKNNYSKAKKSSYAPSPFQMLVQSQDRGLYQVDQRGHLIGRRGKNDPSSSNRDIGMNIINKLAEYLGPQDLANLTLTSQSTKTLFASVYTFCNSQNVVTPFVQLKIGIMSRRTNEVAPTSVQAPERMESEAAKDKPKDIEFDTENEAKSKSKEPEGANTPQEYQSESVAEFRQKRKRVKELVDYWLEEAEKSSEKLRLHGGFCLYIKTSNFRKASDLTPLGIESNDLSFVADWLKALICLLRDNTKVTVPGSDTLKYTIERVRRGGSVAKIVAQNAQQPVFISFEDFAIHVYEEVKEFVGLLRQVEDILNLKERRLNPSDAMHLENFRAVTKRITEPLNRRELENLLKDCRDLFAKTEHTLPKIYKHIIASEMQELRQEQRLREDIKDMFDLMPSVFEFGCRDGDSEEPRQKKTTTQQQISGQQRQSSRSRKREQPNINNETHNKAQTGQDNRNKKPTNRSNENDIKKKETESSHQVKNTKEAIINPIDEDGMREDPRNVRSKLKRLRESQKGASESQITDTKSPKKEKTEVKSAADVHSLNSYRQIAEVGEKELVALLANEQKAKKTKKTKPAEQPAQLQTQQQQHQQHQQQSEQTREQQRKQQQSGKSQPQQSQQSQETQEQPQSQPKANHQNDTPQKPKEKQKIKQQPQQQSLLPQQQNERKQKQKQAEQQAVIEEKQQQPQQQGEQQQQVQQKSQQQNERKQKQAEQQPVIEEKQQQRQSPPQQPQQQGKQQQQVQKSQQQNEKKQKQKQTQAEQQAVMEEKQQQPQSPPQQPTITKTSKTKSTKPSSSSETSDINLSATVKNANSSPPPTGNIPTKSSTLSSQATTPKAPKVSKQKPSITTESHTKSPSNKPQPLSEEYQPSKAKKEKKEKKILRGQKDSQQLEIEKKVRRVLASKKKSKNPVEQLKEFLNNPQQLLLVAGAALLVLLLLYFLTRPSVSSTTTTTSN